MADVTISIPDAIIPDLTQALALRMAESSDAAVKAVAVKVIAGTPTTSRCSRRARGGGTIMEG